jgi:hypothetical protein
MVCTLCRECCDIGGVDLCSEPKMPLSILLFEGRKSLFCNRSVGGTFAGTGSAYRITLTVSAKVAF